MTKLLIQNGSVLTMDGAGTIHAPGWVWVEGERVTCRRMLLARGWVDILVNNASVWQSAPFLEITRRQWETSLGVNLTVPFLCAQAVAPYMLEQKPGHIVNISDLSAHQTWPRFADHSAGKAGLEALTRVMAAELAPHVRVNAI